MREAGLGDLIAEPEPPTADELMVLHCWAFLGGWQPERLPLYEELFGIDDWDLMIELLLALRTALADKSNG